MYYVYALKSINHKYIYVGLTSNIEQRLKRHNNGHVRSTKARAPYKLIYKEECRDLSEAREKELYYKSGCGKEFLKSLL